MNEFEKQWPIGALVEHKELGLRGRIIGNKVWLAGCEVCGLEVHFYILNPPNIKYTTVIPEEIERIDNI